LRVLGRPIDPKLEKLASLCLRGSIKAVDYILWYLHLPLLEILISSFHILQMEHAHRGLEPLAVAAIPTMKYEREAFHSNDDAQ
jgi:hypothetical protein